MGWTQVHKQRGESVKDFFAKEFDSCIIHECKVVKFNTAYMAVSHKRNIGEVFAVVCLLKFRPKDYFNFGYKDMNEDCGPYAYDCPESILNKLTPTNNEYALKWRAKCRELNTKRQRAPKLVSGKKLVLDQPIGFMDNTMHQSFFIKSVRPLRLVADNGRMYSISNLKEKNYTII